MPEGEQLWKRRLAVVRDVCAALFVVAAVIWIASPYYERQREAEYWWEMERAGLQYYVDYVCTDDCEAFRAGAGHAADAELMDGRGCPRDRSVAFYQGCLATIDYYRENFRQMAAAADADVKYSPSYSPEPWEPEFMDRRRQREEARASAYLRRLPDP